MWNTKDCGTSDLPLIMTKVSFYSSKVVLCIWWIGNEFYYELLEKQMIDLNKYCYHLDQFEVAINKKKKKKKGKNVIFYQMLYFFRNQVKNVTA